MLPKQEKLLEVRHLYLDVDDPRPPRGSSGFAHYHRFLEGYNRENCNDVVVVADGMYPARFWVAQYDEVRDVWIAISHGEQFANGEVVERFSMRDRPDIDLSIADYESLDDVESGDDCTRYIQMYHESLERPWYEKIEANLFGASIASVF